METRAALKENVVVHTEPAGSLDLKETETGRAGLDGPPVVDETPQPLLKRYGKKGSWREGVDTNTSQKKSSVKEHSSSEQKKFANKPKVKTRRRKKPASEQVDSNLNTYSKEEKPDGETSQKETESWNVVLSKKSRKRQKKKGSMGNPKDDRKAEMKKVPNDSARPVPGKMVTQGKRLGSKSSAKTPPKEDFILFVRSERQTNAVVFSAAALKLVANKLNPVEGKLTLGGNRPF